MPPGRSGLPFESSKAGPLRRHRQVSGWDIGKTSAWGINLFRSPTVKGSNLRQTFRDLCFRVVSRLVELDAFWGTDTEKAGPHALLMVSPTWRRGAAVP